MIAKQVIRRAYKIEKLQASIAEAAEVLVRRATSAERSRLRERISQYLRHAKRQANHERYSVRLRAEGRVSAYKAMLRLIPKR
jgi:hypothetical protein